MKMIIVFLLFVWSNFASDIVHLDFFGTNVNWSKMEISIKVSEKIPRVIIDNSDPEYGKDNTAFNLSEARNKTLILAKEKIKIHFARSIESLPLNDEFTIKEALEKNLTFRERYNQFFIKESGEFKVRFVQDQVHLVSSLSLLGQNGLISYLDLPSSKETFPEFLEKKTFAKYSGLILDARHLDFKPSLFPKILTDKGLEIYSAALIDRNFIINNGLVLYEKDPKKAILNSRIGQDSHFLVAINVVGKNKNNLTITTEDAIKLLSNKNTIDNLKKCKVIILVK